jgi:hypothetical protein
MTRNDNYGEILKTTEKEVMTTEIEIAFKTTFNPLPETIVNSHNSLFKQFYRKQGNPQHLFP